MGEKYELTDSAWCGPSSKDDKEVRIPNRIVSWIGEGIGYEANPRRVGQIVRDLDFIGSKPVTTPGFEPTLEQACHSPLLPPEKMRPFRAIAAAANYLAMGRPDAQYSANEICGRVPAPTEASVIAPKRLGRYLGGCPRLLIKYAWQTAEKVDAYSDTDWAGCPQNP